MKYLLDTNIISELRRKRPDSKVIEWFGGCNEEELYLSCLTIGELYKGGFKYSQAHPEKGASLMRWIEGIVTNYQGHILPIDETTCIIWAKLLLIDGTNAIDSLIAAQAKQHNMVLVTRNVKHFQMFDIVIQNPFELQK